jgi:hypothetical protein
MLGLSFIRGLSLGSVALLALPFAATPGVAGSNHGEPPPVYEQNYSGPPIIRRIPGLRILFGDEAMTQDQYDQLNEKKKKKKNQIDESYYEPKPAAPAKPKPLKPAAKAATAPAAKPAAPAGTNAALPQKTASTTPAKPPAGGPLSCEKATEVVSGFGFSSVEASTCTGKLYAFNAKRGGKSFAIKLDPASGQLTEVKKLP